VIDGQSGCAAEFSQKIEAAERKEKATPV